MPTEDYPERPNPRRLGILIIILFVLGLLWFTNQSGLLEEPVEPEGIFVRFILFFKQSTLI